MRVVALPATLSGIVEQIAFRFKMPEKSRHGHWSYRDEQGRVSRQKERGFAKRRCLHPIDHRSIMIDLRDQKSTLPDIPIPPDVCDHIIDDVRREQLPRHPYDRNWLGYANIRTFSVDV